MKKFIKIILLSMLSLLIVIGCSEKSKNETAKNDGLVVKTSKGEVTAPKNPKKIVVFDYGVLDIMDSLGVKAELALPLKSLPKTLEKYKEGSLNAGEMKEPNFEKINEFAPDLIIISRRQEDFYDELSKIAPTLYMATDNEKYMASVFENITTIGSLFGKEAEAKNKIDEISKEIENIKNITKTFDKKVLTLLTNDGKISAYGAGSRFGFIFTDLGLKSVDDTIKASTHGQEINYEYISEKNPDIIYYVDRAKVVGGSKDGGDVLKNTLVENTNAGKNNKIIALDPESWYIVAGGVNSTKSQLNEIKNSLK